MTATKQRSSAQPEPVLVSSVMKQLDRTLELIADKDVVVCLIGESGSGKEVLARRIHERSSRRAQPFVPINCAALPEALFESELFGHERGAFTSANQMARGKVEAASGGTLFLDEIGELPLSVQSKLLRFIENRRFMRVGGTAKIEADVRLVCATLRPLEDEVARGAFRADLFYRIQGISLTVPPLRERGADVVPLVSQLVAQFSAKHRSAPPRISRAATRALRAYSWPGNVRELRNVIEQLCVLRAGKPVLPAHLSPAIRAAAAPTAGASSAPPATLALRLDQPLEAMTDEIIRTVVELEGGNRSRAASRLGIGLRTVQRRLKG